MTDDDGNSRLSRLADEMEAVQLRAATELLGHAGEMLGDYKVGVGELRFLVKSLCAALNDALRVAESRGGRLLACADGERHGGPDSTPEFERGARE
ncbi:hypothetical protein ACI2L4_04320 [Streptomyces sparsogenes]|uniref:hypothetical protein n=1 Tax=Streptomyces sparsogenes TaxID=67365 RepID=UPI0033DAE619